METISFGMNELQVMLITVSILLLIYAFALLNRKVGSLQQNNKKLQQGIDAILKKIDGLKKD